MASSSVPKLYAGVIDDVISSVREAFIDEGVDEQALAELKQVWEKKLFESKAVEREGESSAKSVVQQTSSVSSAGNAFRKSTITHQLAMPTSQMLPQTLLQYTGAAGGVQKAMPMMQPKLTLTVPAHLAQSGLQTFVSAPGGGATALQLSPELAQFLQGNVLAQMQHQGGQVHFQAMTADQLKSQYILPTVPVTTQQSQQANVIGQLDGNQDDTSDDDDEDDFQGDNYDDGDDNDEEQNEDDIGEEDEEPLNSSDDVSEDDPGDLFDTDNVVVCQYDKITRSKNRWKFHLKDGIMNLQGKDFVFQKALGDSEW